MRSTVAVSLLAVAGMLHAADQDMAGGNAAMSAGDYSAAVRHYASAARSAQERGNNPEWSCAILRLADAELTRGEPGDVEAAAEHLTQFRMKNPLRSPGVVQGKLLFATGRVGEGKRYFDNMLKQERDAASRAAILCSRGEVMIRNRLYGEAEYYFRQARGSDVPEKWNNWSRIGEAYALVQSLRCAKARSVLEEMKSPDVPVERIRRILLLEILAKSHELDAFKAGYSSMKEEDQAPRSLMFEMLGSAVRAAQDVGRRNLVCEFLVEQMRFAPDAESLRKVVLKLLYRQWAYNNASGVQEAVKIFSEKFPNDVERFAIALRMAKWLGAREDYRNCMEMLSFRSDPQCPPDIAAGASLVAAIAAERSGDDKAADEIYRGLSGNEAAVRYAQFLVRKGRYEEAGQELAKADPKNPSPDVDYCMMETSFSQGKFDEADWHAQRLISGRDGRFREAALFRTAEMQERRGDHETALKIFREFVGSYPSSRLVKSAMWHMAFLAASCLSDDAVSLLERQALSDPKDGKSAGALLRALSLLHAPGEFERVYLEIEDRYRNSSAHAEALLMRMARKFDDGNLPELDSLRSANAALLDRHPALKYRADVMKLLLLVKAGRTSEAIPIAEELVRGDQIAMYPEVEAVFADMKADAYGYLEAADFYARSAVHSRDSDVAAKLMERVGDMYRFRGEFQKAEEKYLAVLSNGSRKQRIAVSFKLGRCAELVDRSDDAVRRYLDVVNASSALHGECDLRWCSMAIRSLIRMAASDAGAGDAARHAVDVCEKARMTELGEDFKLLRDELK